MKKRSLPLVLVMVAVDTLIAEGLRVSAVILLGHALVQQVVLGLYAIRHSIAAVLTQMGALILLAVLRHLLPNNSN